MSKITAKQQSVLERMHYLSKEIRYHNARYHEDDQPEISDFEFDTLVRELLDLETKHPALKLADSPSHMVGGKIKSKFSSFTHPTPMLSLANAMNQDEMMEWVEKKEKDLGHPVTAYTMSLKLDGLALELIYEGGRLVMGATRGDSITGEDITENVLRIQNVSATTTAKEKIVVRGEVIMSKQGFESVNREREREGLPSFSSPRNTAAGMLRQLDPNQIRGEHLHFYGYQLANPEEIRTGDMQTHSGQLQFLKSLGFDTNEHWKKVGDFSSLAKQFATYRDLRKSLAYEIDGAVIKIDDQKDQNALGVVGRKPRFAIAWKFPPTIATTTLKGIQFQVGRTGVITPVGILDPVLINGVKVQRVTLHNQQEIEKKDLRLGDRVELIRSGDVIPKILRRLEKERTGKEEKIFLPKRCPKCQTETEKDETGEGIILRCPNSQCPAQRLHLIRHFISKNAMNIDGLGQEFADELLSKQIIQSPADLYQLTEIDLDQLDRMGEKLKSNLLTAIDRSKQVPLSKLIYALGVRDVGEVTAKALAAKFKNIESLFHVKLDDLQDMEGIGEAVAKHIQTYFGLEKNQKVVKKMLQLGVNPVHVEQNHDGPFSGKKLLFTGTLGTPRRLAKERAEKAGATLVSSLSKNTDYLVVGESPGSKLKKAQELNVAVLTEEKFLQILG